MSERATAQVGAKPLVGKCIVVTRAREQSESLSSKVRALGAAVVECPAIAIAPLEDYSAMDEAIAHLAAYDWVIFTSVNGVEAFVTRMIQLGHTPSELSPKQIGAIGPATAKSLTEAGCPPTFVPSTYVAEAILEQIGDVSGCRILLPRADIARKAVADDLRQRGAVVDEIAAYRTVAGEQSAQLAHLLQEKRADAITFTSSSTVRYTIENLALSANVDVDEAAKLLSRTNIVCIGPITAATAGEYGLPVAKIAASYTTDGLVSALVDLLQADPGGKDAGN